MRTEMGLRERKRLAAMHRIQEVAIGLFDAHGFGNVTIEEIARSADVSASSVYRYFGTKEHLVLWDDVDVQVLDVVGELMAEHPPVEALRRAIAAAMTDFFGREEDLARRKVHYWMQEPALQLAAARQTEEFAALVAAGLAQATGRPADDLEVQVVSSALVWGLVAAARHWYASGFATPIEQELEQALGVLERGLRID